MTTTATLANKPSAPTAPRAAVPSRTICAISFFCCGVMLSIALRHSLTLSIMITTLFLKTGRKISPISRVRPPKAPFISSSLSLNSAAAFAEEVSMVMPNSSALFIKSVIPALPSSKRGINIGPYLIPKISPARALFSVSLVMAEILSAASFKTSIVGRRLPSTSLTEIPNLSKLRCASASPWSASIILADRYLKERSTVSRSAPLIRAA
ncbi:hypothetical protein ES702_04516 [subsurface metagenome]